MKITPIEKIVLVLILGCLVCMAALLWKANEIIVESGGIRSFIVAAGKEAVSISKEIAAEEQEKSQ